MGFDDKFGVMLRLTIKDGVGGAISSEYVKHLGDWTFFFLRFYNLGKEEEGCVGRNSAVLLN